MRTINHVMLSCLLVLLGSCTEEIQQKGTQPVPDSGGDAIARQEVSLSLKNKLTFNPVKTKGETIATAKENEVASLDVYVFASETENGDYSFMERFAYRSNPDDALPAGASELQLTATDTDGKETTGLLKVKKGLFVKLYCIANNTALVDPTHEDRPVGDATFVPLTFTTDGNETKVTSTGVPLETTFTTWHTPLLTSTVAADTLATPLAMTGALTTPLDLTNFESAARVQAGIRLTRLVARYDIVNDAESSRFTVQTISMGNARRGSGLFPIRPYGDMPQAKPDELITYPECHFYGANANKGIQAGAFYSYPSPIKDNGFLILKGIYKINETESKEVAYRIPFTQQTANNGSAALEINNNHRYTIELTKADEFHLDFNITIADWTDDGKIDDYTPGFDDAKIDVKIPASDTETKYDTENRLVAMSLNPGTTFDMFIEKKSDILPTMTKTYTGGYTAQEYDWLEITSPIVTTKTDADIATSSYKYTFALKADYTQNHHPRAVVRFTNPTNGEETILFVEALEPPKAMKTTQKGPNNHSTFNETTCEAQVYRFTDSNLQIKLFCTGGVEVGECPSWLTPQLLLKNNGESLYQFTLNDVAASPADDKGTIVFKNAKYSDKTLAVTVQLMIPDIAPNFTELGGTDNTFTPASGPDPDNISMRIADGNTFKIKSTSLAGIKLDMNFNGGPEWLRHDGEVATKAGSAPNTVTFYLVEDKLPGAKPVTVTLKNKLGGTEDDYIFTVTPDFVAPALTSSSSITLASGTDMSIPTTKITGYCYGGCTIVADESPEWLTYDVTTTEANTYTYNVSLIPGDDKHNFPTALPTNQTITLASNINPDKKTTVTVSFTDQGWVEKEINQDVIEANGDYRVKSAGKTLTLTVYSMFDIPKLETTYAAGYGNNRSWLPSPSSPQTSGYGHNRKKFTYQVVIPASSGTDAAYQLHKGTIVIKQGKNKTTELTLWRGASNIPYPTTRSDNPYYSAVQRGDLWWAPINLGGNTVPKNATDLGSVGKYYQWGRNVGSTWGGAVTGGPTSNVNATNEFISGNGSQRNWLNREEPYLWRTASGEKTNRDPCPSGWRVPTIEEMGKWGTGTWNKPLLILPGQNGIDIILPGAGCRYYPGNFNNQGNAGYYWSSTLKQRVYFSDNTATLSGHDLASAFTVRCVKE